jgi:hypothetical protein
MYEVHVKIKISLLEYENPIDTLSLKMGFYDGNRLPEVTLSIRLPYQ